MPQPSFQEQINAHTRSLETLQEEINALKARVGRLESERPLQPPQAEFGPGHDS